MACSAAAGSVSSPGSQIDSAVVDARPVQRQVIAPVPGRASRDYNAQIAVSVHETPGFPVSGQFEALRLYDIDTDGSAYLNGSVPLTGLHGGAGDDPVPRSSRSRSTAGSSSASPCRAPTPSSSRR